MDAEFNRLHPKRAPTTVSCVYKLVGKFEETGSVDDKPDKSCPSWRFTIWKDRIIGPFFQATVTGDAYLNMLRDEALPSVLNEKGSFPAWFQQDGAPPHYSLAVRTWLVEQFPDHCMGCRGLVEWPAQRPDLTPLDFYLCGHLKSLVYAEESQSLGHLRERIAAVCSQITPQTIRPVLREWVIRLRHCEQQNGQRVEHIL